MVDPDVTEHEEAREPDELSLDLSEDLPLDLPELPLDTPPESVSAGGGGESPTNPSTDGEPEAPTADDTLEARFEHLEDSLASGLASLLEAFESKLAYDGHKNQQIDRLHDELQEHKKDLLARTTRPWIHGLIRLHDDLGRTTDALGEKPPEELTTERFFKTLAGFGDDLVLLLERNGVHPFEAPGEDFDPRRQTTVRRVETDEPERVGRIAERVRPGFEQGAVVVQKERVAVYVAASPAQAGDTLPVTDTSLTSPPPTES
jgi:molecular chaperone GrpE